MVYCFMAFRRDASIVLVAIVFCVVLVLKYGKQCKGSGEMCWGF